MVCKRYVLLRLSTKMNVSVVSVFIRSTANNDAYNYALRIFGYPNS